MIEPAPRYRDGARLALPICAAVGLFGASFGVVARASGWGVAAPIVMSATTFGGSAQFAAVTILASGGGLVAAIVAAVLLNARYLPIGLTVASIIPGGPLRRFFLSMLLVDESWALSGRPSGFDRHILLGAGAAIYVAWVSGTTAGAIFGGALGDPNRFGLDAAFPALFLALLVGQVRTRWALSAALLGAAIAALMTPLSHPGIPILAACLACLIGLFRR